MSDLTLQGGVLYCDKGVTTQTQEVKQEETKDESIFESKLTLGDKMKAFNTGFLDRIVDGFKETIDFAKKNPLLAAGVGIGVAGLAMLLGATGPIGGLILGAIGVGIGGYGIYNSGKEIYEDAKNLKEAKSDEEMLEIIHEMGGDSFDLTTNVALTAVSASQIKSSITGLKLASQADDLLAYGQTLKANPNATESQLRKLDWDAGYYVLAQAENDSRLFKEGIATGVLLADKATDKVEEEVAH